MSHETTPVDEYQEKRDQLITDMAAALDVPVEVLTPIEDGVNLPALPGVTQHAR